MCVRLDCGIGWNAEADGVEPWLRWVSQKYGRSNSNYTRGAHAGAARFFGCDLDRRQASLINCRRLHDAGRRHSHEQRQR